ncbi:MAG: hypothetical protein ACOVQX_06160 [Legionella sp.]
MPLKNQSTSSILAVCEQNHFKSSGHPIFKNKKKNLLLKIVAKMLDAPLRHYLLQTCKELKKESSVSSSLSLFKIKTSIKWNCDLALYKPIVAHMSAKFIDEIFQCFSMDENDQATGLICFFLNQQNHLVSAMIEELLTKIITVDKNICRTLAMQMTLFLLADFQPELQYCPKYSQEGALYKLERHEKKMLLNNYFHLLCDKSMLAMVEHEKISKQLDFKQVAYECLTRCYDKTLNLFSDAIIDSLYEVMLALPYEEREFFTVLASYNCQEKIGDLATCFLENLLPRLTYSEIKNRVIKVISEFECYIVLVEGFEEHEEEQLHLTSSA